MGLGLVGSAIANAVAQTLAGVLFVRALVVERVPLRPAPAVIGHQLLLGRDLLLRGAAMHACFLSTTAVAARFGTATVAAHQIAVQLWLFSSLVLDAVAIAAQSLVGAALGGRRARGRARVRPGRRARWTSAARWPACQVERSSGIRSGGRPECGGDRRPLAPVGEPERRRAGDRVDRGEHREDARRRAPG
jgi:hypothetical protein